MKIFCFFAARTRTYSDARFWPLGAHAHEGSEVSATRNNSDVSCRQTPLVNRVLCKVAPSILAEAAHDNRSEHYTYIPTSVPRSPDSPKPRPRRLGQSRRPRRRRSNACRARAPASGAWPEPQPHPWLHRSLRRAWLRSPLAALVSHRPPEAAFRRTAHVQRLFCNLLSACISF